MIQKLSHTTVYVLDHDSAKKFYVDTLGMEVRTDAKMGDFRWLTVGPKAQPDLEIALMEVKPGPMMDATTAETVRALVKKGTFGCGVLETADVERDYAELKAKGVHFKSAPEKQPYGIACVMQDDSGNWFSLTQPM